jgi:glycosyltransferase involved in cell wall biosynthesis
VKIIYFSKGYTPHDHRFLSRLVDTDYEVYFLQMEETSFGREERPIPDRIVSVPWREEDVHLNLTSVINLRERLVHVLKDIQPDLVHAGPVQQSAFLTTLTGFRPLVSMSWGYDLLQDAKRGLGGWIARYTLARSRVLICDCQAVAEVAQGLGMPRDRIVIFPWGVDLEHFSPGKGEDLRESLGWEDSIILLSTRNWEPIYGVDVLCKAFIKVAQRDENVRLLLLGEGSLKNEIEQIIDQSGMERFVHKVGHVSHEALPAYYQAADLYLSASHIDGSSISLLEALACGLPALVSDIPGNREWVAPGINGWWFTDGSSDSLTDAIWNAIQDKDQLRDFGSQSREIAQKRADWKKNFEGLLHAYQLALSLEQERH